MSRWRYQMPLPGGPGGYRLSGTETHEHLGRQETTYVVWIEKANGGWSVKFYDNREDHTWGPRYVETCWTLEAAQAAGERWLTLVDSSLMDPP